jgi:hypothetical protein
MQQASIIMMLTTNDVSAYLKKEIKTTRKIIMDKEISQKLINHIGGTVG